jgi:WD40 repeat protein
MSRLLIAAGALLLASTANAEEAARIRAMAELPNTYGAVYSPDGKRIAFLSNRSGTPQVWLVDAQIKGKGSEPRQLTQSTDPVGGLAWSPVSDTIAYDVAAWHRSR